MPAFNDITGGSDVIEQSQKDRMYRQFVANTSKARHDDLAVWTRQLQEATDMFEKEPDTLMAQLRAWLKRKRKQ